MKTARILGAFGAVIVLAAASAVHADATLDDPAESDAIRVIEALRLFGIGASWGGFESLATPADMRKARTVTDWSRHPS